MALILVADDEPDILVFVRRGLELDRHAVVAVADGGAALAELRRPGADFALLLSDIRMPVMDGIQLALAAASARPDLPILLMTGYADQRERARGLETLIADVLQKPFSLAVLRETVARTLAAPA